MEPRESKFDARPVAEAFAQFQAAMARTMRAFRAVPALEDLHEHLLARCSLCGEHYEARGVAFDRICPNCLEQVERVAKTARTGDLAGLLDRSSWWTDAAIRYGRPWQEHVPAHSRHLIREDT